MSNISKADRERAEKFYNAWQAYRNSSTEQENQVGQAYISIVLGAGDKVAEHFLNEDSKAWDKVSQKQPYQASPDELKKFWLKVQEIYTDLPLLSDDDISFLSDKGRATAAFRLIEALSGENYSRQRHSILARIRINTHVNR
ncbi:hypothetical protein IID20_02695 [Patescibacteria group bacterium]|nr:hypothetical protein [Patescibacteria group bacterium]